MARTVTRLQLRTRARQLANMESATTLWPDADVSTLIDTHITNLYDDLRAAAPPDYYSSLAAYTVTAATGCVCALPETFLDAQSVYVASALPSSTTPALVEYHLKPIDPAGRAYMQAPTTTYYVGLEYTPTFTTLGSDVATFDGVNGWDELVVALVARDLLHKARESTEAQDQKIAELKARIRAFGDRDRGSPRYMRDVDELGYSGWPGQSTLCGYRIRGSNIEFFENRTAWP